MFFRNNLAYGTTTNSPYIGPYDTYIPGGWYPETNNTWDNINLEWLGGQPSDSFNITAADFYYDITDSLLVDSMITASRNADGSLPINPFRLAEGSDLIDAGAVIPLGDSVYFVKDYIGLAPDVGPYEYGTSVQVDAESITITAAGDATTIEANNGTLQMSAEVSPDTATFQGVTWSTHGGTGSSTINQSGEVQAVSNGTDTIRATAQDGTGISDDYILTYSNQNEITVPTIITSVTQGDGTFYITSGGDVPSDGGASVTQKGICWNTTGTPTLSDNYTIDGTGTGSYTTSLTFGTPGIIYYIKAYAINSEGTVYGDTRQSYPLFTSHPIKMGAGGKFRFKNGKPIMK